MKLSFLVENNALLGKYYRGEWGLSLFIEEGGKKILFDTGYSDNLLFNASKMNIDLRSCDSIILSHGHPDHAGGLEPLVKYYIEQKAEAGLRNFPRVIAHPKALQQKFKKDGTPNCVSVSKDYLQAALPVELNEGPVWLTDKLVFLGEIERKFPFEGKPMGYVKEGGVWQEDRLLDDTALAYVTREGLVIITGCSHAGICNIVEQARRICKTDRILDIIGGLHLQDPPQKQLQATKQFLCDLNLKNLHACHCTDLKSKLELATVVPLKEVGIGLRLEYI